MGKHILSTHTTLLIPRINDSSNYTDQYLHLTMTYLDYGCLEELGMYHFSLLVSYVSHPTAQVINVHNIISVVLYFHYDALQYYAYKHSLSYIRNKNLTWG